MLKVNQSQDPNLKKFVEHFWKYTRGGEFYFVFSNVSSFRGVSENDIQGGITLRQTFHKFLSPRQKFLLVPKF